MTDDRSRSWDELQEAQSGVSAEDEDVLRILEGKQPTYGLPPLPDGDGVDAVERWAVQEQLNDGVAALREGLIFAESKNAGRVTAIVKETFDNTSGSVAERYAATARQLQVTAGQIMEIAKGVRK